jgi:hypothetical protein
MQVANYIRKMTFSSSCVFSKFNETRWVYGMGWTQLGTATSRARASFHRDFQHSLTTCEATYVEINALRNN